MRPKAVVTRAGQNRQFWEGFSMHAEVMRTGIIHGWAQMPKAFTKALTLKLYCFWSPRKAAKRPCQLLKQTTRLAAYLWLPALCANPQKRIEATVRKTSHRVTSTEDQVTMHEVAECAHNLSFSILHQSSAMENRRHTTKKRNSAILRLKSISCALRGIINDVSGVNLFSQSDQRRWVMYYNVFS